MLPKADYASWHNLARHSIQSVESVDIAVDTLTELLDHHKVFLESTLAAGAGRNSSGTGPLSNNGMAMSSMTVSARATHRQLLFQAQVLRHLGSRAASNEKRIQNNISFVCPRPFLACHVAVFFLRPPPLPAHPSFTSWTSHT
jgi:hypothetical protein